MPALFSPTAAHFWDGGGVNTDWDASSSRVAGFLLAPGRDMAMRAASSLVAQVIVPQSTNVMMREDGRVVQLGRVEPLA